LREDRTIRTALALALSLGAVALLYFQAAETSRSNARRLGFSLGTYPDGALIGTVLPGWPAAESGLQKGDRLLRVDGIAVHSQLTYSAVARNFRAGRPVIFRVQRGGRLQDLILHPGLPFPLFEFLFNALAALGFVGVGLLALSQGGRDLRTGLLLGFSVAVAAELLLPSAVAPVIGHGWVETSTHIAFALLTGIQMALELHLASLIPERPAWLRRRPWVVSLYYWVGLVVGGALCATYVSDEVMGAHLFPWTNEQAIMLLNRAGLPCWALAVSVLLGVQALRYPEARGRHQAGLVLTATAPWFLLTLFISIMASSGNLPPSWFEPLQTLVLLLYPVALFAAIFRFHLFDIELMVRRGLLYTTLSSALVVLFYAVVGALSLLLPPAVRGSRSPWALGITMLLLGLLFAPLRQFTHRLIDRGFFPERNDLRQQLIALAGQLPALGNLPRMGRQLVCRLTEIFGSTSAVLLIASPESGVLKVLAATGPGWEDAERWLLVDLDDPGIEPLKRATRPLPARQLAARSHGLAHRLADLDLAGLAVPLLIQESLVGVLVIGGKTGAEPYPAEEQDLLSLLAHQVASMFENARLFESATYESLTGLLRREAILEQLDRELERAQRYGRPLTVAMADLDYFKEINDRYGHLAGDTLLKAISQVASEGLRSADLIGRYGGEEFLLVLPETEIDGAVTVAEKIRALVQETAVPMDDGDLACVTISIGLASLREAAGRQGHVTVRDLIAAADRSLYEAKNGGRNRVNPMVA
jgi:diguanylate cyclase (GGDEF)-like protein